MSAAAVSQNLLLNPRPHHLCPVHLNRPTPLVSNLRICPFELQRYSSYRNLHLSKTSQWQISVFQSGEGVYSGQNDKLTLDAFLSVAEVLCIAPSAFLSIGCALNSMIPWGAQKSLQVSLVNRFLVWQSVFLAGAVVIGAFIRRRQWQRTCRYSRESGSLNLVDRIEKLEEDLRSSTTIVRALSRQLEKLGIRFRVTRKTLKEPITEAAALAQKNSEATRALAMQEELLERELVEIQNVLLAMQRKLQEQQQKQLELILAIGKSGKLIKSRVEVSKEDQAIDLQRSVPDSARVERMEAPEGISHLDAFPLAVRSLRERVTGTDPTENAVQQ
ncbi:hypothetical protein ACLOJK_013440 [Asimina triloba]